MKKTIYFDKYRWTDWPALSELEPFFLTPEGQAWWHSCRNDSWGIDVKGLSGTADMPEIDQVTARLFMIGNPSLGVYLGYSKWDGRIRRKVSYVPKGNLNRLGEFVESLHETLLSVGLFVPFPLAWMAVKEFMETDGELPKSIEWIATDDLPPETFPMPRRPSERSRV